MLPRRRATPRETNASACHRDDAVALRMVGGELGSLLWASHLDLSLRLVFFWVYLAKVQGALRSLQPWLNHHKKRGKKDGPQSGDSGPLPATASLSSGCCDATHFRAHAIGPGAGRSGLALGGVWGLEAGGW